MADVGEIKAKLTLNSSDFSKKIDEAKSKMAGMNTASQDTKRNLDAIQKASLAVGSAVVASIGASVGVAANFEAAMARVGAVSNATGADFELMEAKAKELGETTMFSATQAAEGMQFLAMAGFEATEIVSAMPAVLDLAASAQIGLGQSADIVSNIMTGFGLAAEDTGDAVDVLVKTMTTANTDLPMLGEAMKYVAPVAASLGLSIEETAAAVAKMSDAGIQGSQAGTALRAALLSLANPTGQTVKAMESLGINVLKADGAMKPLPELIGHIAEQMDGMTDAQKTQAAAQLVGVEAASGFIAMLEVGEEGLRDYVSELENAGGTAERVAKTQMDTLKGSFIEFQSAVEGLGIKIGEDLLPAFTEIVRVGTDLVRGLGDANGAAVKSGLAFVGTAAGIGLVLSSIGKLSIALRAFTLTPVGAAITALSVLGGMIAAVKMNSDNLNEVTLESAEAMTAQRDELAKNIAEFDSLQSKSRLTNDELARFVDINSEISKTADPAIIAALKDEQEKLREKSGLSNDELQRLVDLNGKIIEVVPESNTTLTEQGNVLLNNTDAAKKYNAEQLELIRLELEAQKAKAESNMQQLLLDETRLLGEQKALKQEIIQINDDEAEQRKKIGELEGDLAKALDEGKESQARKIEFNIALEKKNLEELKAQRAETAQAIVDKQKEIDKVQQQIGKLDEVKRKMIDLELKQVGINAKRGDEVKKIDDSIRKLEAQKKKLQETVPINQRNTGEYAEAVGHIEEQISELNTVKSRIRDIIGQAGSMNTALGKSITKDVIIRQVGGQSLKRMPGLDYHTGGIVGRQQMPMLHTGGLASQFANTPNHNEIDVRLMRDEMVLTEAQQANLMRMIDAGFSQKETTEPNNVETTVIVQPSDVIIDGHKVGEITFDVIDRLQGQRIRMTRR